MLNEKERWLDSTSIEREEEGLLRRVGGACRAGSLKVR